MQHRLLQSDLGCRKPERLRNFMFQRPPFQNKQKGLKKFRFGPTPSSLQTSPRGADRHSDETRMCDPPSPPLRPTRPRPDSCDGRTSRDDQHTLGRVIAVVFDACVVVRHPQCSVASLSQAPARGGGASCVRMPPGALDTRHGTCDGSAHALRGRRTHNTAFGWLRAAA